MSLIGAVQPRRIRSSPASAHRSRACLRGAYQRRTSGFPGGRVADHPPAPAASAFSDPPATVHGCRRSWQKPFLPIAPARRTRNGQEKVEEGQEAGRHQESRDTQDCVGDVRFGAGAATSGVAARRTVPSPRPNRPPDAAQESSCARRRPIVTGVQDSRGSPKSLAECTAKMTQRLGASSQRQRRTP